MQRNLNGRREAEPGEWEGRVQSQQSTTLSHKNQKGIEHLEGEQAP